jgi:hypothetical protein
MRPKILSVQSNPIIVGIVYACSFLIPGENPLTIAPMREVDKPVYISADEKASLFVSEELEQSIKFEVLRDQWHSERKDASWASSMAILPSYQKIIGMGPLAVPIILRQMESEGAEPDHWFWALHVITGANPVSEADRGNIVKMAAAWLEWGRAEGYAG